jgi:hypothetical protein
LKDQLKIVDRIKIFEINIKNYKNSQLQKIIEVKSLKQSILQQAFNGELVKAA